MKYFTYLILAALFSTAGNITLKKSKSLKYEEVPSWVTDYHVFFFIAVFFYMLNLLLFSKALETVSVSVGYPILAALGFFMLAVSSSVILKEALTNLQIIGLITVVVGIFLLAYSPDNGAL